MIKTRQLQQLAAAMAHEVRNPLNSMAIHAELLEGRLKKREISPADREAALRSVTVLAGEIERMDGILDEYLRFAGPEESTRRAVDPVALVNDALERARPDAQRRGVSLEAKVLPPSASPLAQWVVDSTTLGDAIDALVANAIEASPAGAAVLVEARASEDHAEVRVADRGDGIAVEDQPKVFQIGFSRRGRSGIGLTVAKQIVKGHGGSLSFESDGSRPGATFIIRIPLEAES